MYVNSGEEGRIAAVSSETGSELNAPLSRSRPGPALVAFYEGKTAAIIQRYGPGPRVHYHTGILDTGPQTGASKAELRSRLLISQERMLEYAAEFWRIRDIPFRKVLDVGCGLGGGAIFWAEKFGANVTAVTIAPSHLDLVSAYARKAGVSSQIEPLLCDASAVPGEALYDAAIAIDSSSSFERRPWFRALQRLLRGDGHVLIFDCFLGRAEYEEPFNRHWCARIGTIEEYVNAAAEAGFRLKQIEDLSSRAYHFWSTSIALMREEAAEEERDHSGSTALKESLRIHSLVQKAIAEGGLKHVLMSFVRE
jgi:tocopherol O-methyltransferase